MTKLKKLMNFLQTLLREVINLIITFFKPFGLDDPILKIPDNIKTMSYRLGILGFGMTIVSLIFSFIMKISNVAIEYRFILLGIIFFMLYKGQKVLESSYFMFKDVQQNKFEQIFTDEITFVGAKIIGKVSNKVLKFDTDNNFYRILSNEETINSIKNYLNNLWKQKIKHIWEILEMLSIFIMLLFVIVTNTAISQKVFIPIIIGFVILSFFSSAYINLKREKFLAQNKKFDNRQSIIINDLIRVPTIVNADIKMRIDNLRDILKDSNSNTIKFYKSMNKAELFNMFIELFCQYGIIVFSLLAVEWSNITLSTMMEITATLIVVETALSHAGRMAQTLNFHSERIMAMKEEENDMNLILEVYNTECNRISKDCLVDEITINPFKVKYREISENDKPFALISQDTIEIKKGEVAILSGVSGSGKSTFMKMLTERIKLEKTVDIPSTDRYLFYDETMQFGSLSLFEELFCCIPNPNFSKMQEILENLHLWQEIKSNCVDVWRWMKEKKFGNSLSNGQKQRLILAKMLYWLNDTIDVVVLDECTSGLDDRNEEDSADAERILEYIIKYCNNDKKRIVVISTHQNIFGIKEKLQNITFRNFYFKKEGDKNLIKEIIT